MSITLYLPPDEPDPDLAADYLELKAIFSEERQSFSQDIVDTLDLAADRQFSDVDAEVRNREEIADGAVARMASRRRVLAATYPFELDDGGNMISFITEDPDLGQAAYLLSLLLSNLSAISPLLGGSKIHPSGDEVRALRQWFQYFATAALAAEIGGQAWSFGFPRPDRSGFIRKLSEIWAVLKDGSVGTDPSAPAAPKDDQVDVFAWREPEDGLPGFLLAAAQVATGKDWKNKSIKSQVDHVFPSRWFKRPPVTRMIPYHVIPFARPDEKFRDDVLVLGNVLHRLRVPLRVREAEARTRSGVPIEAFDQLEAARDWIASYVERSRGAH